MFLIIIIKIMHDKDPQSQLGNNNVLVYVALILFDSDSLD